MIGAIIAIGIDINDHFLIILAMVVILVLVKSLVNVPICVHIILRGYLSSLYDALSGVKQSLED